MAALPNLSEADYSRYVDALRLAFLESPYDDARLSAAELETALKERGIPFQIMKLAAREGGDFVLPQCPLGLVGSAAALLLRVLWVLLPFPSATLFIYRWPQQAGGWVGGRGYLEATFANPFEIVRWCGGQTGPSRRPARRGNACTGGGGRWDTPATSRNKQWMIICGGSPICN